jgi:glyoxylase-like metal-dependent hydrolase (beta-lactamase superfamily II)
MFGDIVPLANNLWMIVGDIVADVPNTLVYQTGDHLYLLDSGAGAPMRRSILKVLREVGPVESFTLLNSHTHADHIGNNDLIHLVEAKQTHHYLSEAGLARLDPPSYFADQFAQLSAVYDPLTGFQAHRQRWRFAEVVRDLVAVFVGERRALELFFSFYLRKFEPFHPSPETIQTYETLPKQNLMIGSVPWTGWSFGKDEVWVLEERGHTPDEVLFYLPEHQLLHTADLTFPLFPTFPDTNGAVTQEMLRKCHTMAVAGTIQVLVDSHHHPQAYRGQEAVVAFLEPLFTEQEHFQAVLREILEEHEGLTVGQVYTHVRQRHGDPVVQHYLSLEFPSVPMPLQQIIAVSLLQMGYEARGPRRKKRFYRPTRAA